MSDNIVIMLFNRKLIPTVEKLSQQFPALILTGARQTGKTTLLKTCFKNHDYITLDLPSEAEMAEEDPEAFLNRFKNKKVIIDEAQYAPKLFRHLKVAIDNDRKNFGQFIITGSQKFSLMKEVSDSLAGRCVWLELEGLSLSEIHQQHDNVMDLNFIKKLLTRGSLPELWERLELSSVDYYRTYLATYLERDVRQILNVSSLRDFERFIRLLAIRNASLLNMSEISKDVGVTLNTIKQWITVLEASNQIFLLEPYFSNSGKRVIKSPKVYFSEIGMLSYLLGLNEDNVLDGPFVGNLWESFICSEFRKNIKNSNTQSRLWFYRDQRAREIDFLFEHDGKLDLYEVKWNSNNQNIKTKTLTSVHSDMNKYNKHLTQIGTKNIISRATQIYQKEDIHYKNLKLFL